MTPAHGTCTRTRRDVAWSSPTDVSVIGVDNHRVFAEALEPQLTTVELPHYEMGYWATRKLVSLIEGREPDDDEPETTAPPAAVGRLNTGEDSLHAD